MIITQATAERRPSPVLIGGALIACALGAAALHYAYPQIGVPVKAAAGLALAGALIALYARDHERCRARRAALFADCLDLFESYKVVQSDVDYPVLHGRYRGQELRLEPVLDDIACRKLPSLWLKATLLAPMGFAGALDFLVRPRGVEFYSPSEELSCRVALPESWPTDAALRSDDPALMPPLALVSAHIAAFDDPQMKEMVITPHGVRLVRQIWQAERSHYLVLRQAVFGESKLSPLVLASLLERLLALSADLAPEPQRSAP